jgi:5-methylcytosine-specific restriction enzyme A
MSIESKIITALAVSSQESYEINKAKKAYIKSHMECALCGSQKGLEVHHIKPVHVDITMACDHDNMITLCDGLLNKGCHWKWGHFENFSSGSNPNIREFAIITRVFYKRNDMMTHILIEEFSQIYKMSRDEYIKYVYNVAGPSWKLS